MRIRVEIERHTPNYKKTRSRNNRETGRIMIIHESSVSDVKAELRALRNGGAFEEGFAFKAANLYDAEAFNKDPLKAKPFMTLEAGEDCP